jgi:hypothetical protein
MTWPALLGGVVILNLAALLLAPGRGGRVVGVIGTLLGAALLVTAVAGRSRRWLPDLGTLKPLGATALLAPFLLPLVSRWLVPQVAFLRLDTRVLLALAWLVLVLAMTSLSRLRPSAEPALRPRPTPPPLLIGVFVLWACVFWSSAVWDLGISGPMLAADRARIGGCRGDPLTNIFRTWETQPVSEHLFLAWRAPDDFQAGRVSTNHAYPYLLSMYGFVKSVQAVTGLPLPVATHAAPFMYMLAYVLALVVLVTRSEAAAALDRPVGQLALFLGLGFLLTNWRFWNDLYRFNLDSPFHLVAPLLVVLWACRQLPIRPAALLAAAGAFAALNPFLTPTLILALACLDATGGALWPRTASRRHLLIRLCAVCLPVAALSYLLPGLVAAWKGYTTYASTLLFRSGLDGDVTYFSNVVQAFASPCPVNCCGGRSLMDLLFPAFVPLLAFGLWALLRTVTMRARIANQLVFLSAPYLVTLVLTPQAVSIHPYLYDHLLLAPVVIVGAWYPLLPAAQRCLRRSTLLLYILGMAGLIMANLIALAQALARWPW